MKFFESNFFLVFFIILSLNLNYNYSQDKQDELEKEKKQLEGEIKKKSVQMRQIAFGRFD